MADKTVIEQLAAANEAVKDIQGKHDEASAKVTALEKSVADISAERDSFKAQAEKAGADFKAEAEKAAASAKKNEELESKVKALEAKLADPSFKAASVSGEQSAVPVDGKTPEPQMTLAQLEKAYMTEKDPSKLASLREQIFKLSK